MRIEDATRNSEGVYLYPIIIQEKNGEYIPILDKDGNVETNNDILKRVDGILVTVEPNLLQKINAGFRNQIQESANKVNEILGELYNQKYNSMFDFTSKVRNNTGTQLSKIDNGVNATVRAAI